MKRNKKRIYKNQKGHTLDEMEMQINQIPDEENEEEGEESICMERQN